MTNANLSLDPAVGDAQPFVEAMDAEASAAGKVLIVEDMEDQRWVLSRLVQRAGFVPVLVASGGEALAQIQQVVPDLVLLDVGLPDMDGFSVLAEIKEHAKAVPVIMLTALGKTQDAVRAMRAGAYDYVTKPFKHDELLLTLRRALEERVSKRRLRQICDRPQQAASLLNTMGTSAAIRAILSEVELVAPTNFSVLVTGETGAGKELVARAIHAQSLRAGGPLIVLDCGAIPEQLIESELFGHEKGSFTGAHQAKAGAFELAEGGTIFLDEIANLPVAMQAKLLRVLETRRIHRIGGTRERAVDFRVVAATNADLQSTVEQQAFRRDLYHRLAEFSVRLPPLRERKEDLSLLVNRILVEANKELGKDVVGLSNDAWKIIYRYAWPGNVRELRNQLRRAVLLCNDPDGIIGEEFFVMLDAGDHTAEGPALAQAQTSCVPAGCPRSDGPDACPILVATTLLSPEHGRPLKELVGAVTDQVERAILLQALKLTEGNKARCARMLSIDYKTIQNKLKAHEVSSNPFQRDPYQKRLNVES